MAVPKKKISQSRRGMRRSHDALTGSSYNECQTTGELKLSHNAYTDEEGNVHYRGRIIKAAKKADATA